MLSLLKLMYYHVYYYYKLNIIDIRYIYDQIDPAVIMYMSGIYPPASSSDNPGLIILAN